MNEEEKKTFILYIRGTLDHQAFKRTDAEWKNGAPGLSKFEAWIWLLEKAAYKPRPNFIINNQNIPLDIGELSVPIRDMEKEWGWTKSRVETFLKRLRTFSMISSESRTRNRTTHKTGKLVLTICNYKKYQKEYFKNKTNNQTTSETKIGQGSDKDRTTYNKEIKEIKKRGGKYTPPTEEEVKVFFKENGFKNDPRKFYLKNKSENWKHTNWKERAKYLDEFHPDFKRSQETANVLEINPLAKIYDYAREKEMGILYNPQGERVLEEYEHKNGKIDLKISREEFCKNGVKTSNKKSTKIGQI